MLFTRLFLMAALLVGATTVRAQEGTPFLTGTFTIQIYSGQGGGNFDSPDVQALLTNGLINESNFLDTVTWTGPLNFGITSGPTVPSTIGEFFATGTGQLDGLDETTAITNLSSGPFADTTVFVITFTKAAIPDGIIVHDDGIGLYVNGNLITTAADAEPQEATNPTLFKVLPPGDYNYTLVYVAANGNPSILAVRGTPVEPQPDFVDFGCQIDLTQTGVDNAFKTILSATASEKFCPPANSGGVLKLGCSGIIPNYTGGAVVSSESVVCKISGSQCKRPGNWTATVKSISISAGDEVTPRGFTRLECEATLPNPG